MEQAEATVSLDVLFDREAANAALLAQAIDYCADAPVAEGDVAAYLDGLPRKASQIQSGPSLVAVLVRRGGLARTILVDGELYEGTLEQLQADDDLPADALVEFLVQATPAALDVVAAWRAEHAPEALLAQLPHFAPAFLEVLSQCQGDEGKTTGELQEALIAAGHIRPGLADAQEIHASYFTGKLEKSGALVWDRKRWRTTPEGAALLASQQ